MEIRNNKPEIERRYVDGIETREAGEGQKWFGGYATKFNIEYNMGWYIERVAPTAFDGVNMSDVAVLQDHDSSLILGRTSAGTAIVRTDATGLYYEFLPPNSPNGQNIVEAIRRGDVKQSSWGFTVRDDVWEQRDGQKVRTITSVGRLYDVSPVTFPASPDTTAAEIRAEQFFKEEKSQAILQHANIKRKIDLELELQAMSLTILI